MTEAGIEECKTKLKVMQEALCEIEDKLAKIMPRLNSKTAVFSELGKAYLRIGTAFNFKPVYDGVLLYENALLVLSSVNNLGKHVSETIKFPSFTERIATEITDLKKKVTDLYTRIKSQTYKTFKKYKRACIDYEKATKNVGDLATLKEKGAVDPLLKFVVSAQENNLEKVKAAKKEEENAEKELIMRKNVVDSHIELCNQEMEYCQTLFEGTVEGIIGKVKDQVLNCSLEFDKAFLDKLGSTILKTTEQLNEGKDLYKQTIIKEKSELACKWLWEDEPVDKNMNEEDLMKLLNRFCEATTESSKGIKEINKSLLSVLEEVVVAEENASKALEKHIDIVKGNTKEGAVMHEIANAMEKHRVSQKTMHKKYCQYIQSIALPKVRKILVGLETKEKAWMSITQRIRKNLQDLLNDVLVAKSQVERDKISLKEVKGLILKAGDDPKVLEKLLQQQVSLQDQSYDQSAFIDETRNKFTKTFEQSLYEIRANLKVSKEGDTQAQIALSDCLSGFLSYFVNYLGQYALNENNFRKIISEIQIHKKFNEPLELFPEMESKKEIPLSPATPVKETISLEGSPQSEIKRNRKAIQRTPEVEPRIDRVEIKDEINIPQPTYETQMFKKFGVAEEEIESYNCAFSWKILLQGRLYVTKTALCFYSPFNNATLFGGSTKIVIPLAEVVEVRKRHNVVIFDNSISVHTANAEFFFTSFLHRDDAYNLVKKCIDELGQKEVVRKLSRNTSLFADKPNNTIYSEFMEKVKVIEDERFKQASEVEGFKFFDEKHKIFEQEYECPIQVLFPTQCVNTNKAWKKIAEIGDNYDYVFDKEPVIPSIFTSYKEVLGVHLKACGMENNDYTTVLEKYRALPLSSVSSHKYQHSIKQSVPLPFIPNKCSVSEQSKYFYISPNTAIIEGTFSTSGVPYCDYFRTHTQTVFKQAINVDENSEVKYRTKMTVHFYVEFVKKTMFQGKIEKESKDQTTDLFIHKVQPFLAEYVKEENIKVQRLVESMGSNNALVLHTPPLPRSVVGSLILNDLRKKAHIAGTCNKIMENQRKMLFIQVTFGGVFIILLLFILRSMTAKHNQCMSSYVAYKMQIRLYIDITFYILLQISYCLCANWSLEQERQYYRQFQQSC
eukprot:TRINITY_DN1445_c0_g1_i1.p2 TRINITY_DN1445_c0_g1~~TRINITY_DN1445_c0_g1_i1.p2  ORF type:complete len:1125 (+),score=132.08 TRINITY_DN1445_c0_g1_i1:5163-8537(+)